MHSNWTLIEQSFILYTRREIRRGGKQVDHEKLSVKREVVERNEGVNEAQG